MPRKSKKPWGPRRTAEIYSGVAMEHIMSMWTMGRGLDHDFNRNMARIQIYQAIFKALKTQKRQSSRESSDE